MTIAKDFASKLAVAFVAIAMLFTLIAPAVQAAEDEDLQKTIADLLAQVAALQADLGDDEDAGGSSSCESIPAPLTMGSQGANVTALQNRLIADGQAIAAGATGYFGAQTKAALAGWQAANSVSPAVGYYGPLTMAAMDAVCEPADEDEDEDDDDSSSDELQGEGTLESIEADDASDTDVQEGSEDAEIAELTLEADDGDIEVDRLAFKLDGTGNDEDMAADVFETISLWVDGDMIAEFDASDEDEYLDEDDGTFRFTGLDLVIEEDEEVEIIVAASVMSSVDGAETPGSADWNLEVTEIRYFDADGVAEDEDISGESADFSIVEAGDGEELKFSLGDNNPDAEDIIVDEDDTTDGVTIMEYTIEANEGDIELNTLFVNVVTSGNQTNIVDDIMLVIDGEEFKDEDSVVIIATTSVTYEFDIDGDITIDEDEEVTVEVVVDFKSQDNYVNGSTIKAQVTSTERDDTDAEGMDDVDEFSGTAVGDVHTLVATGITASADEDDHSADATGDNDDSGEFKIEFEVTAVEGDFYINDIASEAATAVLGGVQFAIEAAGTGVATDVSGTLASSADDETGAFVVREGDSETFTLTVTFDGSVAADQYRVVLDEIWFSTVDTGLTAEPVFVPSPTSDFRTGYASVKVAI